jgi:hypothetical protein
MYVALWGVILAKKYRRTTIELDENLYKRVKALAVEKDLTLREIISEALEEKLKREEEKAEASNSDFMGNKLASKLVKAMSKLITKEGAMLLFKSKCEKRGINPANISEEDITDDFIVSLCNGMRYISDIDGDDCVDVLKKAIGGR